MRVVLQRVAEASVKIDGAEVGKIAKGFLILLGITHGDEESDIDWLVRKIGALRVFEDSEGRMNLSINEIGGNALVVSQFTLYASTRKGNRPSFVHSAAPDYAEPLYEMFCQKLGAELGRTVQTGRFGADMQVSLVNDGPVTIIIDSRMRE